VRRERSELLGLRSGDARDVFPLTFWHAAARASRRYTFYAASDELRRRWHAALRDAIVVRRVSQEANMVRGRGRTQEAG
jgi:hypothetical protein